VTLVSIYATTLSEVSSRESFPPVDLKTAGFDPLSKYWIIFTPDDDVITKDVNITSKCLQLLNRYFTTDINHGC
jgi:hypothetical protein